LRNRCNVSLTICSSSRNAVAVPSTPGATEDLSVAATADATAGAGGEMGRVRVA